MQLFLAAHIDELHLVGGGQFGQHARAQRRLVLLQPHQHTPVVIRRGGQADLNQSAATGEVRGEFVGEVVIGGAILAAARAMDDLDLVLLGFGGTEGIGILLALQDELGSVVFLLMAGIAQHTHGEGAVSATAARPEQDERDQRFLHEAALLLGLCGVGFRVGHD